MERRSVLSTYGIGEMIDQPREFKCEEAEEEFVQMSEEEKNRDGDSQHSLGTAAFTPVVGRKCECDQLLNLLSAPVTDGQVLSVIPIVGMGGIGKTTLVKQVFNHEDVVQGFGARGWVWVPVFASFDVKSMIKLVIESLTKKHCALEDEIEMVNILREKLDGRRYLLIFDDVWNEDSLKWEHFINSLKSSSSTGGNKVIVTTRSNKVASIVGTLPFLHLGKLTNDECWEILQQEAFASGGPGKTSELQAIGREIVKKCAGLPLAAVVLGRMLHSKMEISVWRSVEKSEIRNFPEVESGILGVLKPSFDSLPTNLKKCFAYCEVFPKGYQIEKDDLIQLWMALGFLQPSESTTKMEDLGNEYFDELLSICFFEDVETNKYGVIRYFKIQIFMHDLAISISKYDLETLTKYGINDISEEYHLSLNSPECELPKNFEERANKLASFVSVKEFDADMPTKLRSLYALKLYGSVVEKLPPSIGMMKNLRYLDLSDTEIRELPESITQLTNLQTLRLSNCYDLEELPQGFSKLVNLRHLYMDDDDDDEIRENLMPMGLGKLTCLQTLPFFMVGLKHGCRMEELGCLSNLTGKLKLYNLERVSSKQEAEKAHLSEKLNICKLVLHWSCERDVRMINDENVLEGLEPRGYLKALTMENFLGENFAPWISSDNRFLQSLVKVELKNCEGCQQIPTLGQLPYLRYVEVVGLDGVCHIGNEFYGVGAKVFPELRILTIKEMPKLEKWSKASLELSSTSRTLFPRLEELSIYDCPQLISFPDHFPALKDLYINDCKKLSALGVPPQGDQVFSLSSLRTLMITGCEGLRNFWEKGLYFSGLTRLQRLEIGEFSEELENFPWPSLNKTVANNPFVSLKVLILYGWKTVASLPNQIQYFATLTDLTIWGFSGLEALPDWLSNLSSLQLLRISKCSKLMYFPSEEIMHCLTNLRCLRIIDCPRLKERCSTNKGPEWCKISNIPSVEIDGDRVMAEGASGNIKSSSESWKSIRR